MDLKKWIILKKQMEEERYEKQKIIGRGSYGEAYLVKSKSNQKLYVMKTINLGKTQEKPASLLTLFGIHF